MSRQGFARLCVGTLLLLCMAAASPLGLALAALGGSLDRDHQTIIVAGRENVQIVLHHASLQQAHHHGLLARGLTLFSQSTSVSNPDHVLEFVASTPLTLQNETSRETGFERATAVVTLDRCGDSGVFLSFGGAVATGQNPSLPAAPCFLRSTQLLI